MEKKIFIPESETPKRWYNIIADMPNKPLPPLHPETKQPINPMDLAALFPEALIQQEVSTDRFIDIPEQVLDIYKIWRPTPLIRAYNLEKALDTPAKIYYKYEGLSPSGSHKPNTAVAQAYYNKKEGVRKLTTETGAGQWGTALSFACNKVGLECEVYMVKVSYNQKPYRRVIMQTFGANVYASPTDRTQAGRNILAKDVSNPGSLGIAISEAIEVAASDQHTKYALGSVLNHVLLHQTIIGEECIKQMEIAGDFPDIVIAPLGGGSNFAGISFPFLRYNLTEGKKIRCIAAEPASCPKLTKGKFMYDFGDTAGYTPLLPMFTLGHNFMPASIHAGGLRYHGASVLCSQLLKDGLIEAVALQQTECFRAGLLFARTEGILPAPEATHAIAQVIREAEKAKEEGQSKTILFNLCGHGYFDLQAYNDFLEGKITDHHLSDEELESNLTELQKFQPA
ncbi:tryptophan synthase beta chain [Thermaurantimonas aggregans]|uniref:Tryptophan synthase beta chain n=1 Tax=Thermaurantimonas aggregans TaxID=2173829 RepID=A0A401XP03_9FLAO|nr:TrpB-like pyridoxal phosphate-dependent enzyme [Thermaurantimonas aggregans]MCX8148040.1 TrpB-like pyridoxal phosphate-dependent enzyme [Thermaurantimonas aggregans]GCD78741.1 tryptophan synthase beta chain [Thermaurantimonas aggregans]